MANESYAGYDDILYMQAREVYEKNLTYNGSSKCPSCDRIMNPIEFLSNKGLCLQCVTQVKINRARGKMA